LFKDEDYDDIHFLIYDDELFCVVAYAIRPSLSSTETWWYMLLMVVKEHKIMRYEEEGEDKIDSYGAILLGISLVRSFVLVILLIHR
jgi:hypothetical protein